MESEEIYRKMKENKKKDKVLVKVYVNRQIASIFKAIALSEGKTRSDYIGELLTRQLKGMVS